MSNGARVAVFLRDDVKLIERLAAEIPVWAARTPATETLAARLWADEPKGDLTLFNDNTDTEGLLAVISDVDLHHGVFSEGAPLDRVDVYGAGVSRPVSAALDEIGLTSVESVPGGFIARRSGPN